MPKADIDQFRLVDHDTIFMRGCANGPLYIGFVRPSHGANRESAATIAVSFRIEKVWPVRFYSCALVRLIWLRGDDAVTTIFKLSRVRQCNSRLKLMIYLVSAVGIEPTTL